jgi:hypothetical protein
VAPTSSFRTLYDAEKNICYKVPLLRKITRGIRDLPHKELQRSARGSVLLSGNRFRGFNFLPEKCYYMKDPHFNYIERKMPEGDFSPWFYMIASQKFDEKFEISTASQIIRSWMFFASRGIFLEYHTQNILVDRNSNLLYRDLSDVRENGNSISRPSYVREEDGMETMLAAIFDRAVCNQNLDHLFRYSKKLQNKEKNSLKELIELAFYHAGIEIIDVNKEKLPLIAGIYYDTNNDIINDTRSATYIKSNGKKVNLLTHPTYISRT